MMRLSSPPAYATFNPDGTLDVTPAKRLQESLNAARECHQGIVV